jgi:hypothetical protein
VRKILWGIVVLLVLVIAGAAVFILLRRSQPSSTSGPPSQPLSLVQAEAQDVPPLPDLSLQIGAAHELEVFQGTPLIFSVRVANQRAANAASLLQAHQIQLSLIEEQLAKKAISSSEAQAMREVWRQNPDIKVVRLGTGDQGWETFLHFEAGSAGGKPERLNWAMQMVTPPQPKSLTLDATSNAQLDYALTPDAASQVPAGEYSVIAVLEVSAAATLPPDLWRGRVASQPVKLKILPAPARPSTAEQASMNMQKAEFFSTTKDWSKALSSAQTALAADSKLIRAQMIVGEAKEAQGDLSGARDAFVSAKRLFDEKYPKSYEAPEYLIDKIATLDTRLGKRPTKPAH